MDIHPEERVCEIGYINKEMKHALITIINPALRNVSNPSVIQVAVSIDGAIALRAELNAFLKMHGISEH